MYERDATCDIRVELSIPNEKIIGQAREVMKHYTPIVEEALKDAHLRILNDRDNQERLKLIVADRVETVLREMTESYIRRAVDSVFYAESHKLEDAVRDAINKKIDDIRGT